MPRGRERIDCQMPGGREYFLCECLGCPGGMVRVEIERDIILPFSFNRIGQRKFNLIYHNHRESILLVIIYFQNYSIIKFLPVLQLSYHQIARLKIMKDTDFCLLTILYTDLQS